uniref:Uncharacterized protein n=1 Tax=viral metagenome TaxID=1070528 RepID=A0A6C0B848_9ZZZZ
MVNTELSKAPPAIVIPNMVPWTIEYIVKNEIITNGNIL